MSLHGPQETEKSHDDFNGIQIADAAFFHARHFCW